MRTIIVFRHINERFNVKLVSCYLAHLFPSTVKHITLDDWEIKFPVGAEKAMKMYMKEEESE